MLKTPPLCLKREVANTALLTHSVVKCVLRSCSVFLVVYTDLTSTLKSMRTNYPNPKSSSIVSVELMDFLESSMAYVVCACVSGAMWRVPDRGSGMVRNSPRAYHHIKIREAVLSAY